MDNVIVVREAIKERINEVIGSIFSVDGLDNVDGEELEARRTLIHASLLSLAKDYDTQKPHTRRLANEIALR